MAVSIGNVQIKEIVAQSKVPRNLVECSYSKRLNNFIEFVKIDEVMFNNANQYKSTEQSSSIMVTLRPTKFIMS